MAELQATNSDKELSEVEKIAREISSKTQEYMAVLRGNGYALPSHDPNAGRNEALLAPARNLQAELMELTTNLQALVQGPRLHVHNQVLAVRSHSPKDGHVWLTHIPAYKYGQPSCALQT